MSDAVDSTAIAAELHELAAPIRERLKKVEQDIRSAEALMRGLKDGRAQLRTALRAVDPTYEPESKPGRKPGGGKSAPLASARAVERMTAYLEASRDEFSNGNGFTSGTLHRRPDSLFSESYTKAVLDVLHERGVVRLDRVGRGNAHIFVLV